MRAVVKNSMTEPESFQGRTIWMVNSTSRGGGVAEMLHSCGHRSESIMEHTYGSWNITLARHDWERFTHNIGQSPDAATAEDLRRYQLYLVQQNTSSTTLNATLTGLRFFFEITLDRPGVMKHTSHVHQPRKLPVILGDFHFGIYQYLRYFL